MDPDIYHVEGLKAHSLDQAEVLAKRFFKRYKGTRTIVIMQATTVVKTYEATKLDDDQDTDTEDWVG